MKDRIVWEPQRRPKITDRAHDERIVTVTAGIQRAACEGCGHVMMRFAHDGLEDLLLEQPAETTAG
jgi:hypothetical protein